MMILKDLRGFLRWSFRLIHIGLRGSIACLCLTGCGPLMEHSVVSTAFRTRYSCAPENITKLSGSYVVEGCGMTASFVCHSTCPKRGLMDDALYGDNKCVLVEAWETGKPLPEPIERLAVSRTDDGRQRLRVLLFSGRNRIIGVGVPASFPDEVAFHLQFEKPHFFLKECQSRLFADGELVSGIGSLVPDEKSNSLRFSVTLDGLKQMSNSKRMAGEICGRAIEIDASDRRLLTEFYMQFLESRESDML